MKYCIKRCGSILKEIRDLYKYEKTGECNLDIDAIDVTEPFFKEFKEKGCAIADCSRFHDTIYQGEPMTAWHCDWGGPETTHMLLAGYPNPTEIFIPTKKCNLSRTTIEKAVRDGKGYIFTPKRGEVYCLSLNVAHRTNPKAYNISHYVLKIAIGKPLLGTNDAANNILVSR